MQPEDYTYYQLYKIYGYIIYPKQKNLHCTLQMFQSFSSTLQLVQVNCNAVPGKLTLQLCCNSNAVYQIQLSECKWKTEFTMLHI